VKREPINGLIEMLNNSAKVELTPDRLQRLRSLRFPSGNINAIDPKCPYGVEDIFDEDRAKAKKDGELIETNTAQGNADWSER
jgi:hypothetical protein